MYRRAARLVLDVSLLASLVGVVVTGLVIDQLDLHQIAVHSQLGYVMAVVAAIHVGSNWRSLARLLGVHRLRRSDVDRAAARSSLAADSSTAITDEGQRSIEAIADGNDGSGPGLELATARRRGVSRRAALLSVGAGLAGTVAGWAARSELSPKPYDGGDVGEFYHRESSLGIKALVSNLLDWGRAPERYKVVADGQVTPLPPVEAPPTMTVADALEQRRSLRRYEERAMSAAELAWVVQAATGITSSNEYRSAPSAGALYPIETYVAVSRVTGIEAGLYHVDVRAQALREVRAGSVAGDLMVAGLGQGFLRSAPVVLVLTGLFQRTRWKYHQRHYRYVCWEGGHIAQNVYLAAEAAGMGACMVGAFLDGTLNDLLNVDGRREAALGLVAVGPR